MLEGETDRLTGNAMAKTLVGCNKPVKIMLSVLGNLIVHSLSCVYRSLVEAFVEGFVSFR